MRTLNMNKKSDAFICSLNKVDYTVIDKLVAKRKYPIFIFFLSTTHKFIIQTHRNNDMCVCV